MRVKLRKKSEEPRCTKLRTNIDELNRDKPKMINAEPMRPMLLREIELPRWSTSNKDSEDPKRILAETDKDVPRHENDLSEKGAPKSKKSRTDREEPPYDKLNRDNADPMHAKFRSDSEEPNCSKSSTAKEEPNCAMPTIDIDDAIQEKLLQDREEAMYARFTIDKSGPI